jgi:glycosyltransferase involved in cell wall biosynthesis
VSIVIPCYRQAHFLGDVLETALGQTHPQIEIVVVDDAAPDGLLAASIAREFGVRLARTPATLGPGGARNAGIEASCGEYILPVDADDLLAPDYVAKAVAVLDAHPSAGVCYCKLQAFGRGAWTWEPSPGWSLRELIDANRLPNPSVYRRTCWEQAGGYPPFQLCEDWDFWVTVARHGWQFLRIPEYLVFCRQHDRNLTHRLPASYAEFCQLIAKRHAGAAGCGPIAHDVDPQFSISARPRPLSSSTSPGPSSRTTP